MFQGAHPYRIDDKGRLKMPAEFVESLGSHFAITRGSTKGCLWVMPQSAWEPLAARLRGGESLLDQRTLALQRWFIGSCVEAALDTQGRLALPPVLREFAGIEHEVMVVGLDARIEVWSRERWNEYESQLDEEAIAELARSAGI